MTQFFRPYANTVMRVGLFGVFIGPALLGLGLTAYNWSPYITQARVTRAQPIQFSHQHHVSVLGIDCRYCHSTEEGSSFANIPPMHTCMTCHSQVWKDSPLIRPIRESYANGTPLRWKRVYYLPDFVYFNHSIHINKGIGCSTCHGRVDQMPLIYMNQPLYMAWCLQCHRAPEKFVRPQSEIYTMDWQPPADQKRRGAELVRAYHIKKMDDCYVCHR